MSQTQLGEYKELVKDRLSDEAIEFLYLKFSKAAPSGLMTPELFRRYMDETSVYKFKDIIAMQQEDRQRQATRNKLFGASAGLSRKVAADTAAAARGEAVMEESNYYPHLFRAFDLDSDGIITFKEYLIFHLAFIYSTEELFYVIFNAYDEDGDGFLSLGDIKSTITAATRYVGDLDVRDREVVRVIDEEARRLMGFLDIRKQGYVRRRDMRLITQKHPEVLEKMKNLM